MQPRARLTGHKRSVYALAFSPDGHILATGGEENVARLWDAATGQTRGELNVGSHAHGLTFSLDGRTVAIWAMQRLVLCNVHSGEKTAVITEPKGIVWSFAFSPDSRSVATSSLDDLSAYLWEAETGGLKATFDHHPKPYRYADGVDKVAFSRDGKTLVTTSAEIVYLWDVATARVRMKLIDPDVRSYDGLKALKGFSHGDTIYDLAISPDGRTIGTASRDGTAKLWDLATGVLRAKLKGHDRGVAWLAFSPDGRTVATGSKDHTARLWDVATGRLIATLEHKGDVRSLAFSSDGKMLATGSDNEKVVHLWNASTGEMIATLDGARPPVAFSPDGRTLATASKDATVLLWDMPPK